MTKRRTFLAALFAPLLSRLALAAPPERKLIAPGCATILYLIFEGDTWKLKYLRKVRYARFELSQLHEFSLTDVCAELDEFGQVTIQRAHA
jgi:hypothetical protein